MHKSNLLKIWIGKKVIADIEEAAALFGLDETGGVLMGYWADESNVVVTNCIGPGPNAVHTPNSFIPDQEYHLEEISTIYQHFNRTITYLGDWHTHPNAKAYLSKRDKKTLKKIAAYKPARLMKPLMLVLGTNPYQLKVWYYSKQLFGWGDCIENDYLLFDEL